MTPEAQNILINNIAALLRNLNGEGGENGEAMLLLGSAAANLVDLGKTANWREFKAAQTPAEIVDLLRQIDTEGPRMLSEDKVTFAMPFRPLACPSPPPWRPTILRCSRAQRCSTTSSKSP